jgi:hypothetical protein
MKGDAELRIRARATARELRRIGARGRKLSREDRERIRGADLGFRRATVSMGLDRKRILAMEIVGKWRFLHRDEEDDDRFIQALLDLTSHLLIELDEPVFALLPHDLADVVALRNLRRRTTGALAWLCLRTGALGEKRRDSPDDEDVEELARTLRKTREKARKTARKKPPVT